MVIYFVIYAALAIGIVGCVMGARRDRDRVRLMTSKERAEHDDAIQELKTY